MLWIFYFLNLLFKVLVKGYWECGGFVGLFYEMVGVELLFPLFL